MQKTEVAYAGHDLDSMDLAVNYHTWIYELFRPFLGKSIVEVGAGTGAFSKLLLAGGPERMWLIEPSEMFDRLTEAMSSHRGSEITLRQDTFSSVADDIVREGPPDTIVYINVLEHIEDDEEELRLMHSSLAEGGHVCIFVPAVPFLLSDFDRKIGHFRRYSRSELTGKCKKAGFEILLVRGFDLPGVLPWLVKYRMLRSLSIGSAAVSLYDRVIVPLIKPIENVLRPPIGKNLLLVARKKPGS